MQKYQITVRHNGLNKIRVITGPDSRIVEERAQAQAAAWDEIWERRSEKERKSQDVQKRRDGQDRKKQSALQQTADAEHAVKECERLLIAGIAAQAAVDWNSLKSSKPFSEPKPLPAPIANLPEEPKETDAEFVPHIGILGWLFQSIRTRTEGKAKARYVERHEAWQIEYNTVKEANNVKSRNYVSAVAEWEKRRETFDSEQRKANDAIDEARKNYEAGEAQGVADYFDRVIGNSEYPDFFPCEWTAAFGAENRILVVDFWLPAPSEIPSIKEVKYVAARDSFDEVKLKESVSKKLYDDIAYQVCLRTIREIYSADTASTVAAVVFNGWVKYLNPATGTETRACIMSLQAGREEFSKIDLAKVEPKACFRALKGVGSSQLNAVAPVQPVLQLNKEDSRFVASIDVVTKLDEGINLAAIGWEEFEHLIRGIFEREFSTDGGEVKVTRAGHDGGVDAVAFDPDPIRGGKIVIQAKRYTNTVDVSAVRDLYGTVMNEGAIKGILVTTSNYGPDAYAFAKGKPLTLMDGGHLLFLLSKQGLKAHIDLKEAKLLGGSMQRYRLVEAAPSDV